MPHHIFRPPDGVLEWRRPGVLHPPGQKPHVLLDDCVFPLQRHQCFRQPRLVQVLEVEHDAKLQLPDEVRITPLLEAEWQAENGNTVVD